MGGISCLKQRLKAFHGLLNLCFIKEVYLLQSSNKNAKVTLIPPQSLGRLSLLSVLFGQIFFKFGR